MLVVFLEKTSDVQRVFQILFEYFKFQKVPNRRKRRKLNKVLPKPAGRAADDVWIFLNIFQSSHLVQTERISANLSARCSNTHGLLGEWQRTETAKVFSSGRLQFKRTPSLHAQLITRP